MGNELVRRVEQTNGVQQVQVFRVIPKFVRAFAIKSYLRNKYKPKPHFNSANSRLDYKA